MNPSLALRASLKVEEYERLGDPCEPTNLGDAVDVRFARRFDLLVRASNPDSHRYPLAVGTDVPVADVVTPENQNIGLLRL